MATAKMLGLCQRVADDIRLSVLERCKDEGIPIAMVPSILGLVHQQVALTTAVRQYADQVESEAK